MNVKIEMGRASTQPGLKEIIDSYIWDHLPDFELDHISYSSMFGTSPSGSFVQYSALMVFKRVT